MKSKLTLRLDEGLKERAKRLAERRGTSVSKIVEDYFRVLLRQHSGDLDAEESGAEADAAISEGAQGERAEQEAFGAKDFNTVPDELPPRTRRMLREVGPATESLDLDEDTRAWIDAAHEKHA